MNLALKNLWNHPLSSIMGILTAIGGLYTLLSTDPEFQPLMEHLPIKYAGRLALCALIVKLLLRFGMKDPGREEVVDKDGRTTMEDSHELPNDPSAKPVIEEGK